MISVEVYGTSFANEPQTRKLWYLGAPTIRSLREIASAKMGLLLSFANFIGLTYELFIIRIIGGIKMGPFGGRIEMINTRNHFNLI